jgi:hypothetical protein
MLMWLVRITTPKTVESDVTRLSHYMHNKGIHMTDDDIGQATLTSFM